MARVVQVQGVRGAGNPTVPTMMALEMATNSCLRAADACSRAQLGMMDAGNAAVFAEIRQRKDNF